MIKPDLSTYFNAMPLIGQWLHKQYEEAKTVNDLVSLFHKWIEEAETSINPVRKECFKASAYYIYSILTNRSYESEIRQLFI